jgi:hypothetical protein
MFVALRGFYNFYTHLKHNSFYTRTSSTITAFTFEADMKVADSRLDTDKGISFQPYTSRGCRGHVSLITGLRRLSGRW